MTVTVTGLVTVDNVDYRDKHPFVVHFPIANPLDRAHNACHVGPVPMTVTVAGDRGWCHLQRTLLFIHPSSFLLRLAIRTAFLEGRSSKLIKYLLHSPNSASNIETSAGTAGLGGHGVGPPTLDLLFLCCGFASWNPYLSGLMLACLVNLTTNFYGSILSWAIPCLQRANNHGYPVRFWSEKFYLCHGTRNLNESFSMSRYNERPTISYCHLVLRSLEAVEGIFFWWFDVIDRPWG